MSRLWTRAWRSPLIARFVLAGGVVMALYVGLTSALFAAGLATQLALAIGYFTAVSTHFVLYRELVFKSPAGYALSPTSQGWRFVTIVLIQYAVTATSLAVLPGALGAPRTVVYLATAATVAGGTFVILRLFLFHPRSS